MRATLLCSLVLLALAAQVSAQAYIGTFSYSDSSCTVGTQQGTNVTAGECRSSTASGTSMALFCAKDGSAVYTVNYADLNCTTSAALGVSEALTGCGAGLFAQQRTVCFNPSASPAMPIADGSFPPSGYTVTSMYWNITALKPSSTCSTGTGINVLRSAGRLGYCQARGGAVTANTFTASYCTSSQSTSAVFSDSSCSSSTVMRAVVNSFGSCSATTGTQTTCPSSAPSVPSVPATGYATYTDAACTSQNPTLTLSTSTCVDSNTFVCSTVNGTTIATLTQYTDSTNKGLCPTTGTSTTVFSQLADTKFCQNKIIATCSGNTPPPSAASSASVSFVALAIAAVAALFVARSL